VVLVLSRKKKQTWVIDGRVEFEILNVDSGSVQIGIRSPSYCVDGRAELVHLEQDIMVDSSVGVVCRPDRVFWPEVPVSLQPPKGLSQLPNPFVAIDD
jgi:sRNA-binding carbon storage regulator CsrA